MLIWAIKYAKMGLSVIPLKPQGKEPLIKWAEYQKRKATEAEIAEWWRVAPNANIGIVTGSISGLAVVDLDGPEGLKTGLELGLRSSAMYWTGQGKQLWYKLQDKDTYGDVCNAVKIRPGLDIRGEGGYCVVPPSIHPNGKRYRWISALNVNNLQDFPAKLLVSDVAITKQTIKEESWIANALGGMKDGNIDNTLVSILGRMRHDNWSRDDAFAILSPHVKRVGAEDGHLEAKIENIWGRYEPAKPNIQMGLRESDSNTLTIHIPANDDSWGKYELDMAARREQGETRIRTGYTKLDTMLTGGLKSERLLTVAALTGHGKTNFGIGLSKNLCEQRKSVLYFSTEFGYKKVWQRYIATLKNPQSFREHKFNVCDSFTPNIEQVEEAIIRIKPDVFIFDYIQHVSKEKEKLTEFMKGCQFLQRKYGCQGVILAQLNRGADWVEDGKRIEPRMSMIEGSATIEQASSRVLLLSMAKQTPEYYEINGYLVKNDDGDTGLVQFALYRNPYTLREL